MKKALKFILALVLLAAAGWGGWSYWQSHSQAPPR